MLTLIYRRLLMGLVALSTVSAVHAQTPIRFTLDWKYQGVHAPYFWALEKGYFAEEGLEVTIDQGEGSAATITRIMSGAYDAGFGDMNAIIQQAAQRPGEAPMMVYQIYNQPPFAVLALADGPIQSLADLAGKEVGGPAGSASTRLFPVMLAQNDMDPETVEIVNIAPNLQEQMLIREQVAASLVFNVTSYMNLVQQGRDPNADFNWFPYGDHGLDIYSNGVMVSPELLAENPEAVAGLVRAINRAWNEVLADPAAAMAVMLNIEPLLDAEAEQRRLDYAVENLMKSEEVTANGFGAVDPERLERVIGIIASAYDLPAEPAVDDVYTDQFLPSEENRVVLP